MFGEEKRRKKENEGKRKEVKMEKMKKSVRIGKAMYEIEIEGGEIRTHKREYAEIGYANCYGTACVYNLGKDWARITVWGYNRDWATRGHGPVEAWIEHQDRMAQWMAQDIMQEVKRRLSEVENGTCEVKELHDYICSMFYVPREAIV